MVHICSSLYVHKSNKIEKGKEIYNKSLGIRSRSLMRNYFSLSPVGVLAKNTRNLDMLSEESMCAISQYICHFFQFRDIFKVTFDFFSILVLTLKTVLVLLRQHSFWFRSLHILGFCCPTLTLMKFSFLYIVIL